MASRLSSLLISAPRASASSLSQFDRQLRQKPARFIRAMFWTSVGARTDVQNIDLMNLAGFCRNCLSNWLKEEADAKGAAMSKDESREAVYGMPYDTWKSTYQGKASPEQLAAMKKAQSGH